MLIETHICLSCGSIFTWKRHHAGRPKQYCSQACKEREKYKRKKKRGGGAYLERMAQHQRDYNAKNKDKLKCRSKGKTYPMKPHCEICGITKKLERHHKDYSKSDIFKTLCKKCHTNIHHSYRL